MHVSILIVENRNCCSTRRCHRSTVDGSGLIENGVVITIQHYIAVGHHGEVIWANNPSLSQWTCTGRNKTASYCPPVGLTSGLLEFLLRIWVLFRPCIEFNLPDDHNSVPGNWLVVIAWRVTRQFFGHVTEAAVRKEAPTVYTTV